MKKTAKYYNSPKGAEAKAKKLAYDKQYQKSPGQVAARVRRNKSRAAAERAGKVHKGDGKDVHHPQGNAKGPTKVISKSKNRGIK